jgi:hypothetical protein
MFEPGQSGNPNGYKDKRRRSYNKQVFDEIAKREYLDPLITLAKIQHESENEGIRASAAAALAPYTHPKLQALPVPRFIATPFEIPEFHTIQDASTFLGRIPILVARGELDIDFGRELSAMAHAWIDAKKSSEFEERLVVIEQSLELNPSTSVAVSGACPGSPERRFCFLATRISFRLPTINHLLSVAASPSYEPYLVVQAIACDRVSAHGPETPRHYRWLADRSRTDSGHVPSRETSA